MTEEVKNYLLDMLQDISDGFDAYQEGKDEDGDQFWGAWGSMLEYINNMPTVKEG